MLPPDGRQRLAGARVSVGGGRAVTSRARSCEDFAPEGRATAAPGSAAGSIMRRLGVETADAAGNIRNAIDVFDDFQRATARLPQQQQLQM